MFKTYENDFKLNFIEENKFCVYYLILLLCYSVFANHFEWRDKKKIQNY